MPPFTEKIPWFWCVKNRIWNRRMCKHSACKERQITTLSVGPPKSPGSD